ncbi:sugar transferase [Lapidilactobacillus dextrinicus]|uniref:sugar transferase n=1 Tax=Lapidilactobacillus dextrinicus TaxID=51664 RepID=UPI0022E66FE9|nr:sugar transferase [Lapidilactobacillus dextrinicus]
MEQQTENINGIQTATKAAVMNSSDVTWLNQDKINAQVGYLFIKRIFDIVASFAALLILSPLFLVIAILIKLEDPQGPVFYSQFRVGRNGKKFRMYKFRSMCVDADKKLKDLLAKNEVEGAMFKMKDDPRITRVGKWIRKTSVDELPQLWNVLHGDMALVGPRPPLPRETATYSEYDKQRLYVQPGCTGLWQVSGRNDVGFHEMVALDIQYIKTRNLWVDIRIMFKTVGIMIHPNGAY